MESARHRRRTRTPIPLVQLGSRAEESEVARVFARKDFVAGAHIGAHQFIRGQILFILLEQHLPETEMQKRISESARAMHRIFECSTRRGELLEVETRITDGGENPP